MGELERLLIDTIRAIAATIDAKDGYTHRHSERVAALARRLARAIRFTADEQHTAQLAALVHDLGKIAVADSILNSRDADGGRVREMKSTRSTASASSRTSRPGGDGRAPRSISP